MTEPTAAQELKCGQCDQPLSAHRFGTPCRLFVGPSSDVGAEAEREGDASSCYHKWDDLGDIAEKIMSDIAAGTKP